MFNYKLTIWITRFHLFNQKNHAGYTLSRMVK